MENITTEIKTIKENPIYDISFDSIILGDVTSLETFNGGFLSLEKLENDKLTNYIVDAKMNIIASSPKKILHFMADKYWLDKNERILKDF